jgi:hypothetical protein
VDSLTPWSGLGGFLLVVVPIGLLVVAILIWYELGHLKRAVWALVSQLKATREELHASRVGSPKSVSSTGDSDSHGEKNFMLSH